MRFIFQSAQKIFSFIIAGILCLSFYHVHGQNNSSASKDYFTIENYYKAKWGYADEFISLWKKNHYPLLKKAKEKGDIISVVAEKPILHSGEDTRWDFKVTIVFKNVQKAFDPDLTKPYEKALYPDHEKLEKDEQHRFEILIAHWDVMIYEIPLDDRP
ncbi:MAG TPA: hypothetical protein VMI12_15585 [Puia sp.]|nr:hypothetical protein [Puia sp.]